MLGPCSAGASRPRPAALCSVRLTTSRPFLRVRTGSLGRPHPRPSGRVLGSRGRRGRTGLDVHSLPGAAGVEGLWLRTWWRCLGGRGRDGRRALWAPSGAPSWACPRPGVSSGARVHLELVCAQADALAALTRGIQDPSALYLCVHCCPAGCTFVFLVLPCRASIFSFSISPVCRHPVFLSSGHSVNGDPRPGCRVVELTLPSLFPGAQGPQGSSRYRPRPVCKLPCHGFPPSSFTAPCPEYRGRGVLELARSLLRVWSSPGESHPPLPRDSASSGSASGRAC